MLIYKAFRFRIYPTPLQLERLARWEIALRWLWNLANEQHELGLARCCGDKVYVHYASQNRELTILRSLCPWLEDVPSPLCQSVLRDLDTAWRRTYSGLSRRPRYKSRAKDHRPALRCDAPKIVRFDSDGIKHFPKLGRLKTIMHRRIEGKAKTYALVREGDQWFVSVTCQVDVVVPDARLSPSLAIAPVPGGVYASSSGRVVGPHPKIKRTRAQLKRARSVLARRMKGSNRSKRAICRIVKLEYRERRQRAHLLHVESRRIANSQGNVIAATSSLSAGAKAVDSGWHTFMSFLQYKLTWAGGRLIEAPPSDPDDEDDSRSIPDTGIAAAVRILNAWESLATARGRQPARQVRTKRESDARQGQPSQAHKARSS